MSKHYNRQCGSLRLGNQTMFCDIVPGGIRLVDSIGGHPWHRPFKATSERPTSVTFAGQVLHAMIAAANPLRLR